MLNEATHELKVDEGKSLFFKLMKNGDYLFWDGDNWVKSWTNHYYAKHAIEIKK